MKIYLLVEGEKTEMKLYPKWLSFLLPELEQIGSYKSIKENSYYLFCGQGIPSIYNHTVNAIKDINSRLDYDYLVVCLDGENIGVEARQNKLREYLGEKKIELLGKCKLKIVVQNACVETWFLGNKKIVKNNPEGLILKEYLQHYDVKSLDPEIMPLKPPFLINAHFHQSYLKEVFKEHNLNYSKSSPKEVLEESYLNELQRRIGENGNDLKSLQDFFKLIAEIKNQIVLPSLPANPGGL